MFHVTRRDPREIFILLILFGIFLGGWHLQREHNQMVRARVTSGQHVLRVIAPDQERVTATISPYGKGFERELLESFARGADYEITWLSCSTPQQALDALARGEADLYIGQEPASMPAQHGIAAGPAYAHYRPVLVEVKAGEQISASMAQHVLLHANMPAGASLPGLGPQLQHASLTRVPPDFGFSTLLNSLYARTAPMAVLADARFRLWQPFYPSLRPAGTLPEEVAWRWFWRTDCPRFAEAMESFWGYHETETRLAELTERYFGFLPGETHYFELEHLYATLEQELPKYAPHIARHAGGQGINPLLFVALIYQESRFDPRAKSHTGAKGLLQFTRVTADYFKLKDRYDPVESIRAGSAYLSMQYKRLEGLGLTEWDRWCFALAAYNQGMGGLRDAMALARRMGMSGRTWREIKTVFPLLEQEEFGKLATYGTCRGSEAVQFVDSVRYYYYILHGLVRLARPEAQHLGALLDGFVGGSFAIGAPPAPRPLS